MSGATAADGSEITEDDDTHTETCSVPDCNGHMEKYYSEFSLVCGKCGYSKIVGNVGEHTISAGDCHNISSNAYMYFRATGSKTRAYSNAIVKYTSEHNVHRENDIYKRFTGVNWRNNNPLPHNVIIEAANMFISMKKHEYVRRGRNLKGVEGACVFMKCQDAGITKTKAEIALYYEIEEALISFGCSELKKFESCGIIDLVQNKNPTEAYVNAIFETFDIDDRYHAFVMDVLDRIETKRILDINSNAITRVVGMIYTLSQIENLNITHDDIAKNYTISRSTYINVHKIILENATKLIKSWIKYNITLPAAWKSFVVVART